MTDLATRDEQAVELTKAQARTLTQEVKADAERLWFKLLSLYDGGAHTALGYSSWGSYFEAEFGNSSRQGYRLLDAARVREIVASDPRVTERTARELVPLLDQPDQLREAWDEAQANGKPTAVKVRQAVERRVLTIPVSEELLAKQQRDTLIFDLERAVKAFEASESTARAEARRLLAGGDAGPFTPTRFQNAAAFAVAFADELREAGVDG